MRKTPPDILITTPESLYLMISSGAREILGGVETLIVDEIHAVAPSKRGAHMALSLERLDAPGEKAGNDPIQRIGLSATQRPLERVGQFLVGSKRECEIVDASKPKDLDLEIVVPVEDMTEPDASTEKRREGEGQRAARAPALRPRSALDLARDLPAAPRSRQGAHLDDRLREQPPRSGADRQAPERDGERRARAGAPSHRGRRATTSRPARAPTTRATSRSRGPTTAPSPTRSGWWSRSS